MKIGVDTFACDGGKSEIGGYVTQILKRIPPSGDLYELFGWDFDRFAFNEVAYQWEFIPQCFVNGETANALWHVFKYPDFAKKRKYHACFFPAAHKRLPYQSPCPSIGVIHEISPHWQSRKVREQLGGGMRVIIPNSIRRLNRIIAVSNWVKQGLVEFAGVKEGKLRLRIAAAPEDGKANEELRRFLAKSLGCPRSEVILLRGEKSRQKTVSFPAAYISRFEELAGV
jgi:uncharacterized protein YggU (UPF0235/DUF167 family)